MCFLEITSGSEWIYGLCIKTDILITILKIDLLRCLLEAYAKSFITYFEQTRLKPGLIEHSNENKLYIHKTKKTS